MYLIINSPDRPQEKYWLPKYYHNSFTIPLPGQQALLHQNFELSPLDFYT